MSHIEFERLTHPDAKKDLKLLKKKAWPTRGQVRESAETCLQVCSACSNPPSDGSLKNCSRCRIVQYCSKACQKSDWPLHKQSCTPYTAEAISLELSKKLVANNYLLNYIGVYAVISLGLLDNPAAALNTSLTINVTTGPADPLAYMKEVLTRGEPDVPPGFQVMLQVASINSYPLAEFPLPPMLGTLTRTREQLAAKGLGAWPVVMTLFHEEGVGYIAHPLVITPIALNQARERQPFTMKSALSGVVRIPLTEESIIDQLNNEILSDKGNRFHLRTKSKRVAV
ncbi:hypothetical protein B0H10DRAFT_291676 [Mycena sp. CBHHK59/15]|nr:hypothetical protein B0H10DRAFT_291676 [Mycena sp. CBHHK59/15]